MLRRSRRRLTARNGAGILVKIFAVRCVKVMRFIPAHLHERCFLPNREIKETGMKRITILASASTLAIGLAMSAAAYAADPTSADSNTGLGNASGGSTATSTTASGNSIDNGNTNSSHSRNTDSSKSGNTDSSQSDNTVASNNTVTKTSTDTDANARGIGNATS